MNQLVVLTLFGLFTGQLLASAPTDCSDDCYDVHRYCRAIVNTEDNEVDDQSENDYMANWKLEYQDQTDDWIAENKPNCDNDFYIGRCFRTCGVCFPCDYAHAQDLEDQIAKEQDDIDALQKDLDDALNQLDDLSDENDALQDEVDANNALIEELFERLPNHVCESDDDCLNGGTCEASLTGDTSCTCVTGWTGDLCESDVDECEDNANYCTGAPSTCENTLGSANCDCESPYYNNGDTHCIGSTDWEVSGTPTACALATGIITTAYVRSCYDVCSDTSKTVDTYDCWPSSQDGTYLGQQHGTWYRFDYFTRRLSWVILRTGAILDAVIIYQETDSNYKMLGGWGGSQSCSQGVPAGGFYRVGVPTAGWCTGWWCTNINTVKRIQFYDASGSIWCNYGDPGTQVYAPSNCIMGGMAGNSDGYVRRWAPVWFCL